MPDLCLSRPRMSGPAVRKLQKRLAALGFDPGRIDGVFRVQTDRAVRAFQKAQGLTVDGVAGPDTMGALTGGRSLAQHRDATGALSADVIAAVIGCPVENYRTYGKKLGVPLERNPDLALRPDVAAKVLAAYVADHGIATLAAAGDWQAVRRAVNGGLNGWDKFSKLVEGLQKNVKRSRAVGADVATPKFTSPLHLTSPTERSARVKEAQRVLSGHNVFKQNFHPGALDGEWGPLSAAAVEQAKYYLGYLAKAVDDSFGQQLYDYLSGAEKLPPTFAARRTKRLKELDAGVSAKAKAVAKALADAEKNVCEAPVNLTPFGEWYGMNGIWR